MRDPSSRRLMSHSATRRRLLQGTGAASIAAAGLPIMEAAARARTVTLVQSTPTVDISGTSLNILQWQHFVPRFDEWIVPFAQEWGEANDVAVSLDLVNTAEIPAAIAAEVGAQAGHDIIEHIASLPQFEAAMIDMTDLVEEATRRHGPQLEMAKANSYNPTNDVFYGFCHGYAADPGNYRRSLWETVELPDGPTTFDDLLAGGSQIRSAEGVQLGIGMSNEIDSKMAAQALLWAFGGAIQDENENVTINSPENAEALAYMADLFDGAMTAEVFGWNAASNNQLMVAGQASYILNSISAYRTAQVQLPDVAQDIFFVTPLVGPAGEERALAHGHAVFTAMIPTYSENIDTAKEFLLHLVANYDAAAYESELYNFPAFPETVPDLFTDGGLLDEDPFGSEPADKLAVLKSTVDWTVNLGWPGPANAAIGELFNLPTLPNMMASAARRELTPEEALAVAETEIEAIFTTWREQGLVGGGS